MSPYLTGNGGGSSCGSGSGAALGALPFAISEETWGSIVSPCRENHVSGHLTSYGVFSRGGASILSPTMDHFGFHSRWIKDYGVQLVGGCCGLGPEYITAVAGMARRHNATVREASRLYRFPSREISV